jgi:hypothetical protein
MSIKIIHQIPPIAPRPLEVFHEKYKIGILGILSYTSRAAARCLCVNSNKIELSEVANKNKKPHLFRDGAFATSFTTRLFYAKRPEASRLL